MKSGSLRASGRVVGATQVKWPTPHLGRPHSRTTPGLVESPPTPLPSKACGILKTVAF
jgi:hypothetical protein